MPITQANYPALMQSPLGFEGGRANTTDVRIDTAQNADSIILPFGLGVVYPSAANILNGVILPNDATKQFAGIVVKTDTFERKMSADPLLSSVSAEGLFGYPIKHELGLALAGVFLVYSDAAVAPNLPVFLRYAVGASPLTQLRGRWTTSADSGKAMLIPASAAKWQSVTAGPGLAWLSLSMP